MLRKSRKQLTIRFLQRTVLFLVCFSSSLFLFFLFGNMQGFLDATQTMLLQVLSASALATGLLSSVLILTALFFLALQKRRRYASTIVISFCCLLLSSTLAVVSRVILLMSGGF